MPIRPLRTLLAWLAALPLVACVAHGDPAQPIPTRFVPAPQPAHRLVVMLPGRGDSLAGLERERVAADIQREWPDADVELTGLVIDYYMQGNAIDRLHEEIVAPALARGDREVWLAGISLGGMGALLYERAHPDAVTGLLVLSPYLGDRAIQDEIRAAGGIGQWQPGPAQPLGRDNFQRELWRAPARWTRDDVARARDVWLSYGADERFRPSIELLAPALPDGHVAMLPGGHDWRQWHQALPVLLRRAEHARHTRGE